MSARKDAARASARRTRRSQGFLKGAGLASLDQAEKRDTGKGEFWFAVLKKKGGPTAEALPGIIDAAMKALPWPKSMSWGSGTMTLGASAAIDRGAVRRPGAGRRRGAGRRDGADRIRRHHARPSLPEQGRDQGRRLRRLRGQAPGGARDPRSRRAQEDHPGGRGKALCRGAGGAEDRRGPARRGGRPGRMAGADARHDRRASSWTCRPRC